MSDELLDEVEVGQRVKVFYVDGNTDSGVVFDKDGAGFWIGTNHRRVRYLKVSRIELVSDQT
jgi:hypothetical protein